MVIELIVELVSVIIALLVVIGLLCLGKSADYFAIKFHQSLIIVTNLLFCLLFTNYQVGF